jgi:hypothetical protein
MADPQDKSEALDDDVLAEEYPPHEWHSADEAAAGGPPPEGDLAADLRGGDEPAVGLIDQTADADPGDVGSAALDEIDAGESGDALLGEEAEPLDGGPLDASPDRAPMAAEEAAMHVVEEP